MRQHSTNKCFNPGLLFGSRFFFFSDFFFFDTTYLYFFLEEFYTGEINLFIPAEVEKVNDEGNGNREKRKEEGRIDKFHQRPKIGKIGQWALVNSHWSLVISHWSLVISHWSIVICQ